MPSKKLLKKVEKRKGAPKRAGAGAAAAPVTVTVDSLMTQGNIALSRIEVIKRIINGCDEFCNNPFF